MVDRHRATNSRLLTGSFHSRISQPSPPYFFSSSTTSSFNISIVFSFSTVAGLSITVENKCVGAVRVFMAVGKDDVVLTRNADVVSINKQDDTMMDNKTIHRLLLLE
jgi:hypothetical protein